MKLIIKNNEENCIKYSAEYIISRINDYKPTKNRPFVFGLPTGSAAKKIFKILVDSYVNKNISFENIIVFNMDEFVGLDINSPENHAKFLYDNFINLVNIKKENIFLLNGNAADIEEECTNYEKKIKEIKINLFVGGLGPDGHIAHNIPYTPLMSRTRVRDLNRKEQEGNLKKFNNDVKLNPKKVITIGLATLLDCEEVVLCATGNSKSEAILDAVENGISHKCPVSVLQMHNNASIFCDSEAASKLPSDTINYFENILV